MSLSTKELLIKIDKIDFPILMRLQEEFVTERTSSTGLRALGRLEALTFPSFSEYLNNENASYLDNISR